MENPGRQDKSNSKNVHGSATGSTTAGRRDRERIRKDRFGNVRKSNQSQNSNDNETNNNDNNESSVKDEKTNRTRARRARLQDRKQQEHEKEQPSSPTKTSRSSSPPPSSQKPSTSLPSSSATTSTIISGVNDNEERSSSSSRHINDNALPGAFRVAPSNSDPHSYIDSASSGSLRFNNGNESTRTTGETTPSQQQLQQVETLVEAQTVDDTEIQDLVSQGIQDYLAKQTVPAAAVVQANNSSFKSEESDNDRQRSSSFGKLVCIMILIIIVVVVVVVVVVGRNNDQNNPTDINNKFAPSTTPAPTTTTTTATNQSSNTPSLPPETFAPSSTKTPEPTPEPSHEPTTKPIEFPPSTYSDVSNIDDFDFSEFGYPYLRNPFTEGWLFDVESVVGSELSFEVDDIRTGIDRHIAYDCAQKCQMEGAFAGGWGAEDLLCWCYVENDESIFCLEPCLHELGIDFSSRPDSPFCIASFCDYFGIYEPVYCNEFYDPDAACLIDLFNVEDTGMNILYAVSDQDVPEFRNAISSVTGGNTDYWNVQKNKTTTMSINGESPSSLLPKLQDLLQYQCVMVHAGVDQYFEDPLTFSNTLADYVDAGGTVVMSRGVPAAFQCQGRLMDIDYSPVESTPEVCDRYLDTQSSSWYESGRVRFDQESHDSLFYNEISGNFRSTFYRDSTFTQGNGSIKGYFLDGVLATAHRPDYRVVYLNGAYCIGGNDNDDGADYPNRDHCPDGAHLKRWINACTVATYVQNNGGNILA